MHASHKDILAIKTTNMFYCRYQLHMHSLTRFTCTNTFSTFLVHYTTNSSAFNNYKGIFSPTWVFFLYISIYFNILTWHHTGTITSYIYHCLHNTFTTIVQLWDQSLVFGGEQTARAQVISQHKSHDL